MAIFRPKPWINPFGKMSIFGLFELLPFLAYKDVFRQKTVKDIFLAYIAPPKNIWKNCHFFNLSHGLTTFKKCQFFDFLNCFFLFYSLERLSFGLKCRKRNFPFLYCQKIKKQNLEKWPFLDQHNGLTPLKKC